MFQKVAFNSPHVLLDHSCFSNWPFQGAAYICTLLRILLTYIQSVFYSDTQFFNHYIYVDDRHSWNITYPVNTYLQLTYSIYLLTWILIITFQFTTDRAMIPGSVKHQMDDTDVIWPFMCAHVTQRCGTIRLQESANHVCCYYVFGYTYLNSIHLYQKFNIRIKWS